MFLFQGLHSLILWFLFSQKYSPLFFQLKVKNVSLSLYVLFGQRLHFAIVPEASILFVICNKYYHHDHRVKLFIRFKLYSLESLIAF